MVEVSDVLNVFGYMFYDYYLVFGNGSGFKVSSFLLCFVCVGDCEIDWLFNS